MGLEDEENVPTIPFISTIHRKYGIFLNHNMKDYNLSFGQYPILIRLYDEGPSTQQNLAKIFQLNESTITRALNKLEEKEYIEKHPDYENKRKNYVKVTPKGAKIAKEVMDYDEQWDKICSENLSEKEFEEFKTTLKKIYSTIVKEKKNEFLQLIYIFWGAGTPKISKAFFKVVLALSTKTSLVSSTSEPITCSAL